MLILISGLTMNEISCYLKRPSRKSNKILFGSYVDRVGVFIKLGQTRKVEILVANGNSMLQNEMRNDNVNF